MQRTLAIIKPDAVEAGHSGTILERIEREGFRVIGMRREQLSAEQARAFYAVHSERPFYESLVAFMTSGPVVVLALERDTAISHWRSVMGATDPAKAEAGTLRKQLATNVERNAVHGSDAPETAAVELGFFFRGAELL